MLKLEEKIVLAIMASQLGRQWSSVELKRAVQARLPGLGERTVRRVFVRLEKQTLISRDGEGCYAKWASLAAAERGGAPTDRCVARVAKVAAIR